MQMRSSPNDLIPVGAAAAMRIRTTAVARARGTSASLEAADSRGVSTVDDGLLARPKACRDVCTADLVREWSGEPTKAALPYPLDLQRPRSSSQRGTRKLP